jgi:hypothetical protein
MINTEDLKKLGEGVMVDAMVDVETYGYSSPVLIVLKNGGATHETVELPDEDEGDIRKIEVMKKKSIEADVHAMVIFTNVKLVEVAEWEPAPDLKNNPEASTALYIACFRPEGTSVKKVLYTKADDGQPSFFDLGWEENPEDIGALPNPWSDRN